MAVPATVAFRPRQKKAEAKPVDDGFWSDLGHRTASGLQYAGETLNKISRATWGSANALAGGDAGGGLLNLIPFSDTMGLTDPSKGIELSGFLENRGLLPKNKPGLDWYDPVRLAADVGGDLTTYLGGLGLLRGLGKGGSVLSKASKLPAGLSRVGRMTTTVDDLAGKIAPEALGDAVRRSGFSDVSEFLAKHGSEPVGGLASLNKPFGSPVKALGTGPTAQKIGGALDKLGETVRYGKIPGTNVSPGAQMARLFSPAAGGLHTPEVQRATEGLAGKREAIEVGVKKGTAKDAIDLMKQGALDDETSSLGRMYGEGVLDESTLTPAQKAKFNAIKPVMDEGKEFFGDVYRDARSIGVRVDRYGDAAGIQYIPRSFIEVMQNNANTMSREEYLTGWQKGTEGLRQIISDPKVVNAPSTAEAERYIEQTYGQFLKTLYPPKIKITPAKITRKPLDIPQGLKPAQLAEIIKQRGSIQRTPTGPGVHGAQVSGGIGPQPRVVESMGSIDIPKADATGTHRQQLVKELAHRVRNVYTPEQRAAGGFGRNVVLDMQDAKIGMSSKVLRGQSMLQVMADNARPIDEMTGDSRSVRETLEAAEMDPIAKLTRTGKDVAGTTSQPKTGAGARAGQEIETGALHALAKAKGLAPTPENLDYLANLHVPVEQADDLVRLMKGDDIKTTVGPVLQLLDSFTNAFKVGVLSWPARHVRDLTSGQIMNALTGNWSPDAFAKAQSLIAGGTVDFSDIPIVARMLTEQGLEATAENSSDVMRQLIYAHDVFTGMHGPRGAGEVVGGGVVPGQSADFAREFIGKDPLSPFKPQTLLGGSSWKPWKLRGVGGNIRTENRIAATSERAGKLTDGMNRIVPFIHNLQRGMDPTRAKEIIDAIQINYAPSAFTAAEKKYLKRAFPFYSFNSRILKTVLGELADRPGGGIAQTIRATNEMRGDGAMPEHISEGLAIPLGETPTGDKRYLSGLGMMHEAGLSALGNDIPSTLRNIGAMGHPIPKGLAEMAFGKTLFQGRDLEDSDPTLGRLLTNVGLRDELPSGRAAPVFGTGFEHAVANSPLSRVFSSLRTLTDDRKGIGTKALNTLSGARITDVSPRVQRGIMIDALAERMKEAGAQEMSTVRFRAAEIAAAEKAGDTEGAAMMRLMNAAANKLLADAKEDAKARKAKIKPAR